MYVYLCATQCVPCKPWVRNSWYRHRASTQEILPQNERPRLSFPPYSTSAHSTNQIPSSIATTNNNNQQLHLENQKRLPHLQNSSRKQNTTPNAPKTPSSAISKQPRADRSFISLKKFANYLRHILEIFLDPSRIPFLYLCLRVQALFTSPSLIVSLRPSFVFESR